MVVGAFPAAKLGILALKQISKPIANVIKNRAKQSPFFKKYICMPPAQMYNWVEVKTKMWSLNLGSTTKVPQLNEAMATELGANLLGEFVIFVIGSVLLIFEYRRSSKKEAAKEEAIAQEKQDIQNHLQELTFNLAKHEAQIRELTRTIADLESRSWFRIKQANRSKSDGGSDDGGDNVSQQKQNNTSDLLKKSFSVQAEQLMTSQTINMNQESSRKL